jgi:hypothetical protein
VKLPSARLKKLVAVLRPIRPFIERPKAVEALYYLAALLIVVLLAEMLFYGWRERVSGVLLGGAGLASCIGFLVETQAQIRAVLSKIWARVVGKAMYGVLALLANYLAIALVKQFVHRVVHADPKFFPEFIGIVSVGVSALLFLGAIQVIVSFLGLVRLLSSYVVMGFHVLVGPFVSDTFDFIWRLLFGKRTRFSSNRYYLFALVSFGGSVSLTVALAYPTILLEQNAVDISSVLTDVLVKTEFRSGASCVNLSPLVRVAYLDRGWVVVAQPVANGYAFSLAQCNYSLAEQALPRMVAPIPLH